jgi:predicted small secreted protein
MMMKTKIATALLLALALPLGACNSSTGGGLDDPSSLDVAVTPDAATPATSAPTPPAPDDFSDVPPSPEGVITSLAQPNLPNCPSVQIIEGTAALRGSGSADGATGVTYQASVNNVARECGFDGANMTLKVGIRGLVLLGTAGRPGTYNVPIRVVVREGDAVKYSNLTRVAVSVPSGSTQGQFQHVATGIVLPQGPDAQDTYEVLVGIDSKGADTPRKKRG